MFPIVLSPSMGVGSGPLQRARENVTGLVAVLVTGTWLTGLATGQPWWLGFMLFGYVVVVPVVAMLFDDEANRPRWRWRDRETDADTDTNANANADLDARGDDADRRDTLAVLRDRYARGELTDEQFERKLERLLETETLEDVEDGLAEERPREQERERDRDGNGAGGTDPEPAAGTESTSGGT